MISTPISKNRRIGRRPRAPVPMALVALAGILALSTAGLAQTAGPAPLTDAVIHDYLMRHPDAVVEALKTAEANERADEAAQARTLVASHAAELTATGADPVAGNPKGDVTIVEFFDYQCPYCKTMVPALKQVTAEDRNLRIVYKDIPILGPASLVAARAALASRAQDKYLPFHEALMAYKGRLSEESIMATAADVGLDTARLKRDMADPSIEVAIQRNLDLARTLKVHGTPAIVVGGLISPGAIDVDELKQMISAARKG